MNFTRFLASRYVMTSKSLLSAVNQDLYCLISNVQIHSFTAYCLDIIWKSDLPINFTRKLNLSYLEIRNLLSGSESRRGCLSRCTASPLVATPLVEILKDTSDPGYASQQKFLLLGGCDGQGQDYRLPTFMVSLKNN